MRKPTVAIVGRPNVGKSALMNRILRRREAIVESTPGVTRDRLYRDANWNGKDFTLIDTGGILLQDTDDMKTMIRIQVDMAIDEADVILFVVDIRDGVHPLDIDVANMLRDRNKEVILTVNKADNRDMEVHATDFYRLGFGEPIPVSAIQGINTGDLLDLMVSRLPENNAEETEEDRIHVSIVGRPNVGKSSLLNTILGESRAIVTSTAGTTRDAIDSEFTWKEKNFVFIDTAGLRRKSKVEESIEFYSTTRAEKAIKRADIGLIVIDATEPSVQQDKRIAGKLLDEGKGIIIVVNKWDLKEEGFQGRQNNPLQHEYAEFLRGNMEFLGFAPILFVSALHKHGYKRILPEILNIHQEQNKRIDTPVINKLLQEAFYLKAPPSYKGKSLKLFYAYQDGVSPPVFVLKVNSPKLVHFSYKRYLENIIRETLGFKGTPIRLIFKK